MCVHGLLRVHVCLTSACEIKQITHVWLFSSTGDVGNYYYGQGHPMKPHRIRMTHNLLLNYGLYRKMEIYVCHATGTVLHTVRLSPCVCLTCPFVFQRPHKASGEEMTKYHSDDYIKFLRSIRPDNMSEYSKQMQRCKFGPRGGLLEYNQENFNEQQCCCVSAPYS